MKVRTLIFALLLIITIGHTQAVRKVEANPINVAVMLTEQPDSAGISSTCEYYGYACQPSQDGYSVYNHPNGSIIRYRYTTAENGISYPTIEVKSKSSTKEKDHILQGLNFQKKGDVYERRSISHHTRCMPAPQGYLRFSNLPKVKK